MIGSHDLHADTAAAAFGGQAQVTSNAWLGAAVAGGEERFHLGDGLGRGRAHLFQIGVYGGATFGDAYISAAYAYGTEDVTTNRDVVIAGVYTGSLGGQFDARVSSGRLEAGYRLGREWGTIAPYAAVQFIAFDRDGFTEAPGVGGGTFALRVDALSTSQTATDIGVRATETLGAGGVVVRQRLAWVHNFDTLRAASAAFATLADTGFIVYGATPAEDAARLDLGVDVPLADRVDISADANAVIAGESRAYGGRLTVHYAL